MKFTAITKGNLADTRGSARDIIYRRQCDGYRYTV